MEGLSTKQEKIMSLIKPYAVSSINDQNTVNTIICLVLGASEFNLEDEIIDVLENSNGFDFDGIVKKIVSLFPPIEIVDDDEYDEDDE